MVRKAAAEVAALMMQRNRLVAALRDRASLPPLLRDPFSCSRCFQKASCALTHLVRPSITPPFLSGSRPSKPKPSFQVCDPLEPRDLGGHQQACTRSTTLYSPSENLC